MAIVGQDVYAEGLPLPRYTPEDPADQLYVLEMLKVQERPRPPGDAPPPEPGAADDANASADDQQGDEPEFDEIDPLIFLRVRSGGLDSASNWVARDRQVVSLVPWDLVERWDLMFSSEEAERDFEACRQMGGLDATTEK